jgi:hypothetical protein
MTTPRTRRLAALSTALVFGWALAGLSQSPGKKDGDLDDLLKKVDEASKPKDAAAKPARPGTVAPKDKDLDDFLEKLGEDKDKPSADGKPPEPPPGGGAADDMKSDPKAGKGKDKSKDQKADAPKPKKDDGLKGDDKDLDEHLSGADKKKQQQQRNGQGQGRQQRQKQDEEDGPLGDLIKQMREVEQRLGKPDTGEETRHKQTEIVKRLDGLIEQMRLVRSQSQMMRMMRQGRQQGQQQGQMANNDPQQGVGLQKPAIPRPKSVVADDKHPWGHLPAALRDEMENVFKEEGLPERLDLIKRYYISVSKKSLSREE